MPGLIGSVSRTLGINTCAALFVTVIMGGVSFRTPWQSALETFAVSFLFSNCIGYLIAFAMPRVAPGAWRRQHSFPVNAALLLVALIAMCLTGSVAAIVLLMLAGYLPPSQFGAWFLGSLRVSILATLTFGIGATVYETMRARLEATTVALRTKERDEAEARRLVAEARLSALEARVQPHFLFNTLNSISALIHNDPAGADRVVGQLADLMRASLDAASTPLVSLGDELKTVRDYLEIERIRFGDRLRYELPTDGACANVLVPRFSLQTLVENSVKYAVSPQRGGARIVVRAEPAERSVRLTVEDDGSGFDADRLPEHHGLSLLRDRLAANFGSAARLHVESAPGRCAVVLDLPNREPGP